MLVEDRLCLTNVRSALQQRSSIVRRIGGGIIQGTETRVKENKVIEFTKGEYWRQRSDGGQNGKAEARKNKSMEPAATKSESSKGREIDVMAQ